MNANERSHKNKIDSIRFGEEIANIVKSAETPKQAFENFSSLSECDDVSLLATISLESLDGKDKILHFASNPRFGEFLTTGSSLVQNCLQSRICTSIQYQMPEEKNYRVHLRNPSIRNFLEEANHLGLGELVLSPTSAEGVQFLALFGWRRKNFTPECQERVRFIFESLVVAIIAKFPQITKKRRNNAVSMEVVPRISAREITVLTLVASGQSNSNIAKMFGYSEHTVRAYISTACSKLNAKNTTQAVCYALKLGLINLDEIN